MPLVLEFTDGSLHSIDEQSTKMVAIAEGCHPAALVHGRDIQRAASRSLCLVPGEILEPCIADGSPVGNKPHSTQGSVSRQKPSVAVARRWKVGPRIAAIERKLPFPTSSWGTDDRNAFQRAGIDISDTSSNRRNRCAR